MFRITYWDRQYGDKLDVRTAKDFAAAATDVFTEIGTDPDFFVETGKINGSCFLTIRKNDITLAAVIEDNLEVGNGLPPFTEACNAVEQGNVRPLVDIFTRANWGKNQSST